MESSRLTNAGSLNLEDEVGAWQSERHTNATVEYESGILGSLFDALTRFLQTALQEINKGDITLPSYDSVEKSAATLLFWGNDHGVSKGELDRLLHHSMFLRDTVLSVLISISELLSQSEYRSPSQLESLLLWCIVDPTTCRPYPLNTNKGNKVPTLEVFQDLNSDRGCQVCLGSV